MTDTHVYSAGTVIAVATGEYSDFSYIGHIRALRELNLRDLMESFRDGFKPKDEWDEPDPRSFVGWLIADGLVEAADVEEVHIGSYGRLELDA